MDKRDLIRWVELQLGHTGVTPEDRFAEDLAAESVDMMHIVVQIEEQTGLHIPEEIIPEFRTVQDMFDYVEKHQKP